MGGEQTMTEQTLPVLHPQHQTICISGMFHHQGEPAARVALTEATHRPLPKGIKRLFIVWVCSPGGLWYSLDGWTAYDEPAALTLYAQVCAALGAPGGECEMTEQAPAPAHELTGITLVNATYGTWGCSCGSTGYRSVGYGTIKEGQVRAGWRSHVRSGGWVKTRRPAALPAPDDAVTGTVLARCGHHDIAQGHCQHPPCLNYGGRCVIHRAAHGEFFPMTPETDCRDRGFLDAVSRQPAGEQIFRVVVYDAAGEQVYSRREQAYSVMGVMTQIMDRVGSGLPIPPEPYAVMPDPDDDRAGCDTGRCRYPLGSHADTCQPGGLRP
jgi:hypothetical protein